MKANRTNHRDILILYYSLPKLRNLRGMRFNYGVDKNRRMLKDEVEAIEKQIGQPSEEFKKFESERVSLNEKYAERDNDDSAKQMEVRPGIFKYIISEKKQDEYKEGAEKIRGKYKKAIEERNRQIREYEEFLNEENTSFKPFLISIELVPEDILGEQFEIISPLLAEEMETGGVKKQKRLKQNKEG